jgi:hypothetical protein
MYTMKTRNARGQASIPVILIAFLAIGVIGLFAFEVCRAASVRDQLRAATEAAALAGSTALAGSSELEAATSQSNAINVARSVLVKNDIFGVPLTTLESDYDSKPAVNHLKLRMRFIDPKTKNPVPIGDPKGKTLEVQTKFGMRPLFADMVGMTVATSMPIEARAQGGVGDLDIVLCFDVSGSMDDETKITRVRRRWDPGEGKIKYDIIYQGEIGPSAHSAIAPQNLSLNAALRGSANTGTPPGNFPPGSASVDGLTDVVVNLDEQNAFGSFSQDGFDFPSVGVLVEAARGNLENAGVFASSQANTALAGQVAPKPGYQAAYFKYAHEHTHPIAEARAAASDFFNLMNKNSNAHFGLVCFDDTIGSTPLTVKNGPNVSASYPSAGTGNFPIPAITLKQPEDQTNFTEVTGITPKLVALGATNIGGACSKAVDMYTPANTRPNAKKVIIVFTDGAPTVGGPLSGDPQVNCRLAAQKAKAQGIAVYTVGLALDPGLLPIQQAVLGDTAPTGMAKIAGNGSKFFPVTNSSNIRTAFASIARQLSQLVE